MLSITINLEGLKEVEERMEAIAQMDMTPILDDAGAFVLNRIRSRFLREEDPNEQPWIPSKAAIRRRKAGGTGTLFDTGTLFRSIQFGVASDSNTKIIGTDVPYGKSHQFGTDKLPIRAFLGVNQKDADLLEKIIMVRLEKMLEDLASNTK